MEGHRVVVRAALATTVAVLGLYPVPLLAQTATESDVSVPASSRGAEPETGNIETGDIIVTAQRRSQNLRDVPISITALGEAELKERGVTNAMDLPDIVPGVRSTTPGGGAYTTTIIRGVGQQDIAFHQEAPVATYVDGAYVGLTTAATQPLFDLDRVEVLKGPQGTLFGRNATGGLVHYINRQPSPEFDAYTTVEYGSFNKFLTEGAVGGSLGGDWSARFSFHTESGGAFIRNPIGSDHNGITAYAARAQILYKPSSDFSVLLSLYGNRFPSQPGPGSPTLRSIANSDGTSVPVTPANFAAYQAFCAAFVGTIPTQVGALGDCKSVISSQFEVPTADEIPFNARYWNGTLTINAAVAANMNFTSITNYQYATNDYHSQLSPGFPTVLFREGMPSGNQYSQEVRLSGKAGNAEWLVGAYGLLIENHTTAGVNLYDIPKYGIDLHADLRLKGDSIAVFSEVTYSVTPKFSLVLGGRLTRDHQRGVNRSGCTTNPLIPFDICSAIEGSLPFEAVQFSGFDQSFTKTSWSARAVAQYRLTDDVNLYAGINRGTKAGGFNTGVNELYPVALAQFGPETLTNYEGGIKGRFFDRVLTFNGSLFYYDYKNLQTFSTKNSALYVFNIDAIIKGAEFDASLRPVEGLEFAASASYLDTRAKDVPVGTGFADFVVPGAPKFSMNASARYAFDIGPGEFSTTLRFTHVGRRSTSAIDNAVENTPAYDRYDLRVGYDVGRVSAAFNIRNLTDETIYNAAVPFQVLNGSIYHTIAPPRIYSASLTFRY